MPTINVRITERTYRALEKSGKPFAEQYHWPPTVRRLRLPIAYIEHMPTRRVSYNELVELRCNNDFNSVADYGLLDQSAWLKPYEAGHDQLYRYILK